MTLVGNEARPTVEAPRAHQPGEQRYSAIVELTRVRFLEFFREPEAVFWTFIFPILLATGLGIAFRSRPAEQVKVGVVASAPDAESLRQSLAADSTLSVTLLEDSAVANALRMGSVALVIAPTTPTNVEYRYDNAREEARAARLLVDRALQRAAGVVPPVTTNDVIVSERGSRYIDFVLPGLLAMNLMGSSIWGIGFAIVDARRKKLLKRLVSTPMRRGQYLMSFLAMRLVLMIVEVAAIVGFGVFVFKVPMRGSPVVFVATVLISALAFGALGLLIASRAKTVEAASGMMNLVMLPMWVASGIFFAATNFPDAVQPFIQALPLTAVVDALRANMLQGAGWTAVAGELAILGAWLLVSFTIALRIFRWR